MLSSRGEQPLESVPDRPWREVPVEDGKAAPAVRRLGGGHLDGVAVRIRPRRGWEDLITAWTGEVRDERSLLGGVLSGLLLHPVIAAEHLKGVFADVRPLPSMRLRSGDGSEYSGFWSALGGRLKPFSTWSSR